MRYLNVQIVRMIDPRQPGLVTCEFVDAHGRCHTLEDKVPIFSDEDIGIHTTFPRPGILRCAELQRWRDAKGRELVRINTLEPDNKVTTEGLSEFVVLAKLVSATSE